MTLMIGVAVLVVPQNEPGGCVGRLGVAMRWGDVTQLRVNIGSGAIRLSALA